MVQSMEAKVKRVTRLWGWMAIAVVLVGVVAYVSPQQVPVIMYKLALVTVSAVVAYWIDQSLFKFVPHAQLDSFLPTSTYGAARLIARAVIYLGTVLAISLGL